MLEDCLFLRNMADKVSVLVLPSEGHVELKPLSGVVNFPISHISHPVPPEAILCSRSTEKKQKKNISLKETTQELPRATLVAMPSSGMAPRATF